MAGSTYGDRSPVEKKQCKNCNVNSQLQEYSSSCNSISNQEARNGISPTYNWSATICAYEYALDLDEPQFSKEIYLRSSKFHVTVLS